MYRVALPREVKKWLLVGCGDCRLPGVGGVTFPSDRPPYQLLIPAGAGQLAWVDTRSSKLGDVKVYGKSSPLDLVVLTSHYDCAGYHNRDIDTTTRAGQDRAVANLRVAINVVRGVLPVAEVYGVMLDLEGGLIEEVRPARSTVG